MLRLVSQSRTPRDRSLAVGDQRLSEGSLVHCAKVRGSRSSGPAASMSVSAALQEFTRPRRTGSGRLQARLCRMTGRSGRLTSAVWTTLRPIDAQYTRARAVSTCGKATCRSGTLFDRRGHRASTGVSPDSRLAHRHYSHVIGEYGATTMDEHGAPGCHDARPASTRGKSTKRACVSTIA